MNIKQMIHDSLHDEEFYGITGWEADEPALFPDRNAAISCSNWSIYACRVLGPKTIIYGFSDEENPDSEIAQSFGGHDFVVYDGRYLVDAWAKNIAGYRSFRECCVLDLEDEHDAEVVRRFYGPVQSWGEEDNMFHDFNESDRDFQRAMKGTSFPIFEPAIGLVRVVESEPAPVVAT